MSDQENRPIEPEPTDGPDDGHVEVVEYAGLPCTTAVQEAFEQHFRMGFFEARVVLNEWNDLADLHRQGIAGHKGQIIAPHRSIAWEPTPSGVLVTVERRGDTTYSLEWRRCDDGDGTPGAYVHQLRLAEGAQ